MLRDRYEFEYRLDHLCRVTLDYVFHSMSLSCFLPRAFVFLSWFDTSIHFVVTCWMLWDMFITIFLHCTPITGPILHSLFDPWFNFRLDAHMFITKRWKTHFHIHTFFRGFLWSPCHFFSYGARVESWVKDICLLMEYRSRDSVFFTPLLFRIIDGDFSGHICSHLVVDIFMTLEFSSCIQISDCHLRTMCLHDCIVVF